MNADKKTRKSFGEFLDDPNDKAATDSYHTKSPAFVKPASSLENKRPLE